MLTRLGTGEQILQTIAKGGDIAQRPLERHQGFAQLKQLAAPLAKNGYGQYLLRILDEKVF